MSSRSLSQVVAIDTNQSYGNALLHRNGSSTRWALDGLRFIHRTTSGSSEMWDKVATRFDKFAKDGLLAREDFGPCIGMESIEFAKVVFDVLARRRQQRLGKINRDEMQDFWNQLSNPNFNARLRVFFDIVDSNGDGLIDRNEIQELIVLSASANRLGFLIERAAEYANLIMEELDPECHGYIELLQLEQLLLQGDVLVRRPTTTNLSWSRRIALLKLEDVLQRVKWFVINNWRRGWITLLWLMTMAVLFVWKFKQYRKKKAFQIMGYCLCTAKGSAETLKLNMALILLAMCRNTLTSLRSTWVRFLIPFNDSLNFHKVIGMAIVIGIVLHAGNHLACDFPRLVNSSPEKFKMIASHFNYEKPTYVGLLTGIEGITGIAMIVLMAISFTLASVRFRNWSMSTLPIPFNQLGSKMAFWYTHHLHCLVYVLLLIHGTFLFLANRWYQKTTWMYISFPVILFIVEKALRWYRSGCYSADMLTVSNLPCDVFSIKIHKPKSFKYISGQYIYIQCPLISKFQWRPFSLTSAPGDDYLSVHIRARGSWTSELQRILTSQSYLEKESSLKLLVDGPYGAPAQDYSNYDVLLLLGLGIGATPFISILRDLLNHKRAERITGTNRMRVRSARFYWVTKEHASFEWFRGDMNDVAEMAQEGFIDVHTYLTSVYEERDARSTLIAMINDLNHRMKGVDILSGTWVKTHFGRPNWNEVFNSVAEQHPGCTVGVFYCGNMDSAKKLKKLAHRMSRNTNTRFKFHKEQF